MKILVLISIFCFGSVLWAIVGMMRDARRSRRQQSDASATSLNQPPFSNFAWAAFNLPVSTQRYIETFRPSTRPASQLTPAAQLPNSSQVPLPVIDQAPLRASATAQFQTTHQMPRQTVVSVAVEPAVHDPWPAVSLTSADPSEKPALKIEGLETYRSFRRSASVVPPRNLRDSQPSPAERVAETVLLSIQAAPVIAPVRRVRTAPLSQAPMSASLMTPSGMHLVEATAPRTSQPATALKSTEPPYDSTSRKRPQSVRLADPNTTERLDWAYFIQDAGDTPEFYQAQGSYQITESYQPGLSRADGTSGQV